METTLYIRAVMALALVVGLIGIISVLVRKYGLDKGLGRSKGKRRLTIEETMMLDGKRRLVLIRRDEREHLLLLSSSGDVVVERNIEHRNDDAPLS